MKNLEVRDFYLKIIEQYLEKVYICKINQDEEKFGKWFFLYFFVIWLDKSIIKICIVFDVLVKYCGVLLNDMIYCGLKF